MSSLKEGQIYAIDGGFFKAHRNEENECLELWTHEGFSGHVIARTGFEIDDSGKLYHRIFDFETQEHILFEAEGYTVNDLEEVDEDEFQDEPPLE